MRGRDLEMRIGYVCKQSGKLWCAPNLFYGFCGAGGDIDGGDVQSV
jgi:hypothetical protein